MASLLFRRDADSAFPISIRVLSGDLAPALGDVPAAFLTTLDTTGGNSGSAVLDGQGRLVGLGFDGNYESIASDWVFLPEVTRTICVDVRFMGWVMDGWADGGWILQELGISEER